MSQAARDPIALARQVAAGDRVALGRAITIVESDNPAHRREAASLIAALPPGKGDTYRIGVSGLPGAGKSTFVNRVGLSLIEAGHKVAVLAVDPTSVVSGGSILGDKTRMGPLTRSPQAFVRPSPTRGHLGGVAETTSAVVSLVEAAGYDVTLVETVGVGQSETEVINVVDCLLLLLIAGGGDGLQGIKRGILEIADSIAINKADGPGRLPAEMAARELASALKLMRGPDAPEVHCCSALEGEGVDEVMQAVIARISRSRDDGSLRDKRGTQRVQRLWAEVDRGLRQKLRAIVKESPSLKDIESVVRQGTRSPLDAAQELIEHLTDRDSSELS